MNRANVARIAYCMLRGGRWGDAQVIPRWFVDETAASTHEANPVRLRQSIHDYRRWTDGAVHDYRGDFLRGLGVLCGKIHA